MDLSVFNEKMPASIALKLLLLEDDAVSRAFLQEVLVSLPAEVACAENCAGAESLARIGGYALWLFDANLPDGSGADLLRRLRASGLTTPAFALTAESFHERLEALSAAGFSRVLQKPIAANDLLTAIRACGDDRAPAESAFAQSWTLWDDSQALAAVGGKIESARALRNLFLGELPAQIESIQIAYAACDHGIVRDHLHRLKAGCGFVGASRLLSAVNRFSAGMDNASLDNFLDSARRQLDPVDFTPGVA